MPSRPSWPCPRNSWPYLRLTTWAQPWTASRKHPHLRVLFFWGIVAWASVLDKGQGFIYTFPDFIAPMSQDNVIKLECTECKTLNYRSRKNKKTLKNRLEMQKHCSTCGKHTGHKETK